MLIAHMDMNERGSGFVGCVRGFDLLVRSDRYGRIVFFSRDCPRDSRGDDDRPHRYAPNKATNSEALTSALLQMKSSDRWTAADLLDESEEWSVHDGVFRVDRAGILERAVVRVVIKRRQKKIVV